MEHIGIDVHKKESQVCIGTGEEKYVEYRIGTTRERFAAVLGERPRARILIEASTESEWVVRCLEALGHEVIVADPNFAPMYASRTKKVKTDRRDARALAEACRLGAYHPAHRTSDQQRHVRAQLAVRDRLVKTRASLISLAGALLRREGLRVGSGAASNFVARVEDLALKGRLRSEVAPLLAMMLRLNVQITYLDQAVEQVSKNDERVARLRTVPRVGPVTAAAYVAAVDDPGRFAGAHQVAAYLGLVPREMSSGEKGHKGRITKTGNTHVRCLLVEAALGIMRSKNPETVSLRTWADRIAVRRGKRIAAVALARRLAGILFAMMRTRTEYRPAEERSRDGVVTAVVAA